MQQLIGRIRGKLDLSIRIQSDHVIELNDLLLAVEEKFKSMSNVEDQLRDEISLQNEVTTHLINEVKELEKKLGEPVAVEEES